MVEPASSHSEDEIEHFVQRHGLPPHAAADMRATKRLLVPIGDGAVRPVHIDQAVRRFRLRGLSEPELEKIRIMGGLWIELQRERSAVPDGVCIPVPPGASVGRPALGSTVADRPPRASTVSPLAYLILVLLGLGSFAYALFMLVTCGLSGAPTGFLALLGGCGFIGLARRHRKEHAAERRMEAAVARNLEQPKL